MLATNVLNQTLAYKLPVAATTCLGVVGQRFFTQLILAKLITWTIASFGQCGYFCRNLSKQKETAEKRVF